jgi:protocatechuate 3,4-dioxygenase alpha subunit
MSNSLLTGSQTLGPFFHDCMLREDACRNVLATPDTEGERIRIVGTVIDGDGVPLPDALVEIWQANHNGRYNHPADTRDLPLDPAFSGFGRSGTDADGAFWFETVRPGAVPFNSEQMQAPHICVLVAGRGLLNHLYTRLYFADEPASAADPILMLVPAERRGTLLAQPSTDHSSGMVVYQFNIVLQGEGETVFFRV